MFQQGRTNLVVWGIARAIYLHQRTDRTCYFHYSRFLYYNTRPKPLVQGENGSTAKEQGRRLLPVRHTVDYSS